MKTEIQMASADLNEQDLQAVIEVMHSERLALGPKTIEFEEAMASYVGVKHGIAVSSGTAGLHLIVKALGIGPGDEVLVPSYTFVASVNAILFENATPVFVDIDPETYCLSIDDVQKKITPRTKAIMVVDVFGHPADWDGLEQLAEQHELALIDDCCEALGAEHRGRKLGSLGDAGCFAFYPNKQMTTGEGGLIVTNDDALADKCRSYRNQGRASMGSWLQHENLGFNYRLGELASALGVSQLSRIEEFLKKRERVAAAYTEHLANCSGLKVPTVHGSVRMSWFVYVITLQGHRTRDPFMKALADQGVPSRAYFEPVHLQPYIRQLGLAEGVRLPITDEVSQRTVALPFHNKMPEEQISYVSGVCMDILES